MKKLYVLILSFLATLSYGQGFEVAGNGNVHSGRLGTTISVPVTIENTSDQAIYIVIRRTRAVIGSSQRTYFCWGNEC